MKKKDAANEKTHTHEIEGTKPPYQSLYGVFSGLLYTRPMRFGRLAVTNGRTNVTRNACRGPRLTDRRKTAKNFVDSRKN